MFLSNTGSCFSYRKDSTASKKVKTKGNHRHFLIISTPKKLATLDVVVEAGASQSRTFFGLVVRILSGGRTFAASPCTAVTKDRQADIGP